MLFYIQTSKDKKDIKIEKIPEPLKRNYEPHQSSADSKDKSSLFTKNEGQPVQGRVTAEMFSEEKIVATEKIVVKEENIQV